MALVWMDGFDKYGTVNSARCDPEGILRTRYVQGLERVWVYPGRDAGHSVVSWWDATAWFQTPHLTTDSTIIVGFSMYTPIGHNTGEIFQLRSTNNFHSEAFGGLSVLLNADGSLTLRRDLTTIGTTASFVIPPGWCTLELKIFCDNVAGTYELRVDGVDELSGTGVDTQSDSDSYYSIVRFNGDLASTTPDIGVRIDDFWVCDGAGGAWTDFLGPEVRIGTISPMADAYPNQWDEEPAGDHYVTVNEDTQNDAEYIEADTTNQTELFDYQTPPSINTVIGVQVVTETITTEPSVWDIKTVIKHAGTEDAGAGQVVGTSDWTSIHRLMEKNPVTSNLWTPIDLANIQAGVKVS